MPRWPKRIEKKHDTRERASRIPVPCLQCKQDTRKLLFCSAKCRQARQRQLSSQHDTEIMRLYAEGQTQAEIAAELGKSSQFIGRALRRNKVRPIRRPRNPKRSPLSLMQRKAIQAARKTRYSRKRRMERLIQASCGMMFGF